jgi:hypothetical protein
MLVLALASGAMAATPAQQANATQETSAEANLRANLRNDAAAPRKVASANATECSIYRAGPRDTIRRCR